MNDFKLYLWRKLKQGSAYGWVIEYILPIDMGGKKTWDNVWIVSYETKIK
mgnify:CR=1 FL=1